MKNVKRLICLIVCSALLASLGVSSFALPINVAITDSYFYDETASPVAAPISYRPVTVKGSDSFGNTFDPIDLTVGDEFLYVVDREQCQIIALNTDYSEAFRIIELKDSEDFRIPDIDIYTYFDDGTREEDTSLKNKSKYSLNKPEGIYIDPDGMLYIADTQNRRIVVCDKDGVVYNVIQSVRIPALGTDFVFKPKKLVVDRAGTISVLCEGCNKGVVQIDTTGAFQQFFAQPKVALAVSDWIYTIIGASASKKAQIRDVAAEYVSLTIDDSGFIYTAATDTGTVDAVRKLASDGSDVLSFEDAKFQSFGDVSGSSKIVDVATNTNAGTYTLLDSFSGRFFTYSSNGMQLFVGGGSGSRFGRFVSPVAIACYNDDIIIADSANKLIAIYEMTEYASNIISAQKMFKSGDYDKAEESWLQVLTYNSGMYIAYDTLGKIYKLRGADTEEGDPKRSEYYQTALHYFELSENLVDYAECYKELRNETANEYFGVLFGSIVVLFVGIVALIMIRSKRKKRAEEKRRAGL